MTNRDRVADFVRRFPGRDDDEISAALQIWPRQAINQICRELASSAILERRANSSGKLGNYPLDVNLGPDSHSEVQEEVLITSSSSDITKEWFWEGNVTNLLARYFEKEGWSLLSQANTRTKERGLDLHLSRENQEIMIEVKGYPSKSYRDQRRASEVKSTSPGLQALHWYSHALLKALRLHSAQPKAKIMMGFPDFPRYRTLFKETELALRQVGVGVLFVSEAGQVEIIDTNK